jgi:hypothetical protein
MYSYLLNPGNKKPSHTEIGDTIPEGHKIFNGGEPVDWTQKDYDETTDTLVNVVIIPPDPTPVIPLTKAQKISTLNAEYDPKFLALQMAYAAAGLADNGALNIAQKQDSLTQQNLNLLAEKKAKVTVIINA